jgi:hypothetical protein
MMSTMEARLQKVEDELAIARLRARYCHLLDDERWDAFIDLFTADGYFKGLAAVEGRDALLQFFSKTFAAMRDDSWHFCANGTVDLDGDTATGRISLEYRSVQNGESFVAAGHYDDVMVRVGGEWKFKSRIITFYYFAPLREGFAARPRPALAE